MKLADIPYYEDYISPELLDRLKRESAPVPEVPGLFQVGPGGGLETKESLSFVCALYETLKGPLNRVLKQRKADRKFLDDRTQAFFELNRKLGVPLHDPEYQTVIGEEDADGRIVMGPKNEFYCKRGYGIPVAPIPVELQGNHVTLFGPPDDAKLSINAMNALHRIVKGEPEIVSTILAQSKQNPFWGADDEDSKTPLRRDLIAAGVNLKGCFDGDLKFHDSKTGKDYSLQADRLALPIKRFPGLALPCTFLIYKGNPLPLHLYDFAVHLYANWKNKKALSYYVPKLENEEEATYLHLMVSTAESLLKSEHPEYIIGSVRLFIVLENPRAIFRVNEIMDALHPYFAGASLGWHDYLASTARLFKNDANYRIPVKADPDIVIKYIKASHDLLSEVVGSRGGIKIGGMYGILPIENDFKSPSFQLTLKGFIKDVITQMKRNLSGFWVAHPDFVRMGIALVEAWKQKPSAPNLLDDLVKALLIPAHHEEIFGFIHGPDIQGLDLNHPLYPRSLIVADLKESNFIANHDPEEIRYNVFQSLQYLTDWLSGNGCVALPAQIQGIPVRVMDDLATAERSRWEVWHEIHHGRFPIESFLKIAHEEFKFIRKNLSDGKKLVQVKWDERTEKWYPIALKLMIKLMTDPNPPEFASELLLPLTVESIRDSKDPWAELIQIHPEKYSLDPYIERFNTYFTICGSMNFAYPLSQKLCLDLREAENLIRNFSLQDVLDAASFHGDIGESKRMLDEIALKEQSKVLLEGKDLQPILLSRGKEYLNRFGFKFLISAQGRSAQELLTALMKRMDRSVEEELTQAKAELWSISQKRLKSIVEFGLSAKIEGLRDQHQVVGAQISILSGASTIESLAFGDRIRTQSEVTPQTLFEIASLSKTLASCFALEYFQEKGISLDTPVNHLLKKANSDFRIKSLEPSHPNWAEQVTLIHLMKHNALNMHYVNGIPLTQTMPSAGDLLKDPARYGYAEIGAQFFPGTAFQYSGGGFLVLEHLIESLEGLPIQEITRPFFQNLGLTHLTFEQSSLTHFDYAWGYLENGEVVRDSRLMFPAFAAGAMGTASDYLKFLSLLGSAFHSKDSRSPISHDTAVRMLQDSDASSQTFMGVNIGIGVFIAEAEENRFAIHQGANDGFRSLSLYCYRGPDQGKGFVILCNADQNGVAFVAETAQTLLRELKIKGIDFSRFHFRFDPKQVPSEEIVNLGYKNLVFSAFTPDLPEPILERGPLDPLAPFNLAVDGKILSVTNQRFARAENLLSPHTPVFDPELYGRQGKVMDSWESARHNPKDYDALTFELKKSSPIRYLTLSTQFHLGNQAPLVEVLGQKQDSESWTTLLPKTSLEGHALFCALSADPHSKIKTIKVKMFPDGGLTRIGLFDESLPKEFQTHFKPQSQAKSERYLDPIPQPKKPLTPKYIASKEKIAHHLSTLVPGAIVDWASSAFGGSIIRASNEHYGPAAQIISPLSPLHMFDGLESARSRSPGHTESVEIKLGKTTRLLRIELDFEFFRNNNPKEIELQGFTQGIWKPIILKTEVKAYAGNLFFKDLDLDDAFSEIKLTIYPDGGVNRLRAFGVL